MGGSTQAFSPAAPQLDTEMQGVGMNTITGGLTTTRGVLAALLGVLVIVQSLTHGGRDAYRELTGQPMGAKEQQNSDLFTQHFKEPPVATTPFVVKTSHGDVEMTLDVYENGDAYVSYGEQSQWFPFKT